MVALSATEVNLGYSVNNYVAFETINSTHVRVAVYITGIVNNPDGLHGMHIHQYGDISSAAAMGTHWDPHGVAHGCPHEGRSAGDLGNWQAVSGTIDEAKELDLIDLNGADSVIGRGVVLHNNTDNCADVPSSGARLAGGVIGVANIASNEAEAGGLVAPYLAVCNLFPTDTGVTVGQSGSFSFSQSANGENVTVIGELERLGVYGVHVHTYGDLSSRTSGTGTGGHFDPLATSHHALPDDTDAHHAGDMGNTDAALQINGAQWFHGSFGYMKIDQTASHESIVGRGLIVHEDPDQGASAQPTGASGNRNAQCVIGIANPTLTLVPVSLPTPPMEPSPSGNAASLIPAFGLLALSVLALLF
jgi:Cu-Zn family superoxide dismutase